MNKKKLTSMLVSLGLVAALGAGATLAYLSDTSTTLENTFTFVDKGIDITLDEATIGADNKAINHDENRDSDGQAYNPLLPNMIIDKDPTVTVEANSLDCNVFMSLTKQEDDLTILDMSSAWTKITKEKLQEYGVTPAANTTYYVYNGEKAVAATEKWEVTVGEETVTIRDAFKVVKTANTKTVLEDLFTKVQVSADLSEFDEEGNLVAEANPIIVKAAAVQEGSVKDAEAAKEALTLLGATPVASN